jgi:hypothetical protein
MPSFPTPFRLLWLLCLLPAILVPRAAAAYDPILQDGQTRIDGRIVSVAPDFSSVEVAVVVMIPAGAKRQAYHDPPTRTIRLKRDAYIYRRNDRAAFLSPRELEPGLVVSLITRPEEGAVTASEVLVGGTLPVIPAPPPVVVKPATPPVVVKPAPSGKSTLAKFEPRTGCYLGAFVMRDEHVSGDMAVWEETIGKGHASYLRYVGYGQPFPQEWVAQVRRLGAVPNLAFEPNNGLQEVRDDSYLREFARAAAKSGGALFLRFASEMNGNWTAYSGNPKLYRQKFRLVARVFAQEAPNVAMVWTPYCLPQGNIPLYYPGDDVVDWVGVNIYSVHHHNGRIEEPAHHEDPTDFLLPIYRRYASRKPIQVSEYAATSFCLACNTEMPGFAIEKMRTFYGSLKKRFPRVKMVYWFSWDTISGGAAENNYSVVAKPEVLESYQRLIRDSHFLPRFPRQIAVATQEAARPSTMKPSQ